MKRMRSTLLAVLTLAGGATAIQGGIVYAQENIRIAQQAGSCVITVRYKNDKGEINTKTSCVKEGEAQCNQNFFCAPDNHPLVVTKTCAVVPSCPAPPK